MAGEHLPAVWMQNISPPPPINNPPPDPSVASMAKRPKVISHQSEVRPIPIGDDVIHQRRRFHDSRPPAFDAKRCFPQYRRPHLQPLGRLVKPVGFRLIAVVFAPLLFAAQTFKRLSFVFRAPSIH